MLNAGASSASTWSIDSSTRALTAQREAIGYQVLDVWIRGLPADDMRRAAWLNLDRFSTTWVSCWPSKDAYLTNAEFHHFDPRKRINVELADLGFSLMDKLFKYGDEYITELELQRTQAKRKATLKSAREVEMEKRDAKHRKPLRETDPWG